MDKPYTSILSKLPWVMCLYTFSKPWFSPYLWACAQEVTSYKLMSLMREASGECFKFWWDEGYWKLFPEFMGFLFFDIDVKPNFQESWENSFFFGKNMQYV